MFRNGLLLLGLTVGTVFGSAVRQALSQEAGYYQDSACPGGQVKVVEPTTVKKKNYRICYDCKEVDYASTRCLRTPILDHRCPDGACKHTGLFSLVCECCGLEGLGCVRCGKPHTRKVLIKKIITEEIQVPACKVQRIPAQTPAKGIIGESKEK